MKNNQPNSFSSVMNSLNNGESRQQTAQKLMSSISAEESKELFAVLNDKEKLSAVLNSPAAQAVLSKLNGHK